MTGGLLGTISGVEWLSPLKASVQDSEYLQAMAKALATKNTVTGTVDVPRQGIRSQLNKFKDDLLKVNPGKSLGLPDGRRGEMVSVDETIGKSGKFKVVFCRIAIDDGQSLEVSKIVKGTFADKQTPVSTKSIAQAVSTLNFGIKLPTRELNKAIWFYKEILGLEIKRKTSDIVTFEQGLVLVPGNYPKSQYGGSDIHAIVYIEVADIEGRFSKVKDGGIKIVTPLSLWGNSKRSFFRCSDPDGNVIEVFSTAG
jgi:predicted enzyme related to lactoylglutathione lyase